MAETNPILIVVPTRNRPKNVRRFYNSWKENTNGSSDVVLVTDEDDKNDYSYTGFMIEKNERLSTTGKINIGVKNHLKGHKIIGFLGDDCTVDTENFEDVIVKSLSETRFGMLRPSNGFDVYDNPDHVFITVELYNFLGWFAYPKLYHSFCDYVWRDIRDILEKTSTGKYVNTKDVVFTHYNSIYFPDLKKDTLHNAVYENKSNDEDKEIYDHWQYSDMRSIQTRIENMSDIIMITHNRLEYLKMSLPCLLAQDNKDFLLTIWDNGSRDDVIAYLDTIKDPRVLVIKSNENIALAVVVSKLFERSTLTFIGKIDPDTIVSSDWLSRCVEAHNRTELGVIGGFHFRPEDLDGIEPKIDTINGVGVWQKTHIGGCAFLMRRKDFTAYLGNGLYGFTEFQQAFQRNGKINGYLWNPILYVEHMEDARSPFCIKTKEYEDYKMETRGSTINDYTNAMYVNNNYLKINVK